MSNRVFIETTPLNEALKKWFETVNPIPHEGETVAVIDSLGRVTSKAVIALLSSPFFHSSAMDGYAVRFADTFRASETSPKLLRLGAEAVYVDTGDPLPVGFNAVIMIEDVNLVGGSIEILKAATPWQNVRTVGDDIVATELILPENHRIRPVDIGAMLAGGHVSVEVKRKPRVALIPTGTEIVEPGSELKTGDIIEFNTRMLGGLVTQWGGEPIRVPIVPDDRNLLKEAILSAIDKADIVAVNAGASAGSEDFTAPVIGELGRIVVQGLAIKPGKPAILGIVKGKPVIGVPGYPVSAYIVFSLFAKGVIDPLSYSLDSPDKGVCLLGEEIITVKLSRQVASSLGQEEFIRVKLGRVGENIIATPLGRGAGLLMSLQRADGFLRVPAMSEGFGAGAMVDVELIKPKSDIENTVVCIGSHDNALDMLGNFLKKRHPRYSLSSANVGSMGGLVALSRGEAHIAPTHLLDEITGEYNIPFINKILPGRKIVLINLAYRQQGLMVKKGNPKGIKGFSDLARKDVVFINRQKGAGTRLLLDKYLKELGISPSDINGYAREEYTHMAVASAVLTGVADAGLGILAAAGALGLDFMPVAKERYDLAIPEKFLGLDMIKNLMEIIRGDGEFRGSVLSLGGYDTSDMGNVMNGI